MNAFAGSTSFHPTSKEATSLNLSLTRQVFKKLGPVVLFGKICGQRRQKKVFRFLIFDDFCWTYFWLCLTLTSRQRRRRRRRRRSCRQNDGWSRCRQNFAPASNKKRETDYFDSKPFQPKSHSWFRNVIGEVDRHRNKKLPKCLRCFIDDNRNIQQCHQWTKPWQSNFPLTLPRKVGSDWSQSVCSEKKLLEILIKLVFLTIVAEW